MSKRNAHMTVNSPVAIAMTLADAEYYLNLLCDAQERLAISDNGDERNINTAVKLEKIIREFRYLMMPYYEDGTLDRLELI